MRHQRGVKQRKKSKQKEQFLFPKISAERMQSDERVILGTHAFVGISWISRYSQHQLQPPHKFSVHCFPIQNTVNNTQLAQLNVTPIAHSLAMACWCFSPSATVTAAVTTTTGRYFSIHNSHTSQFHINNFPFQFPPPPSSSLRFRVLRPPNSFRFKPFTASCTPTGTENQLDFQDPPPDAVDCVGTGQDVECVAAIAAPKEEEEEEGRNGTVSLSSEEKKKEEGIIKL